MILQCPVDATLYISYCQLNQSLSVERAGRITRLSHCKQLHLNPNNQKQ